MSAKLRKKINDRLESGKGYPKTIWINFMKIYPNGLIVLDAIDIVCLGIILGYSTGTVIKLLKKY